MEGRAMELIGLENDSVSKSFYSSDRGKRVGDKRQKKEQNKNLTNENLSFCLQTKRREDISTPPFHLPFLSLSLLLPAASEPS